MAKVEYDSTIAGFRGKLDRLTYRKQLGKTVVVAAYKKKDRPSAAQRKERERFQAAHAYAKEVLADPLKLERYRQLAAERNQPTNALLVSNFLNPPTIARVDLTKYQGRAGSLIRVLATDPIQVMSVTVKALDPAGRVLESGAAQQDHDVWVYRCTTALGGVAAKVEITAENRAGTQGTETAAL